MDHTHAGLALYVRVLLLCRPCSAKQDAGGAAKHVHLRSVFLLFVECRNVVCIDMDLSGSPSI